MTDSDPAVRLAGNKAEADIAGREVLIKAKMKAEKVAWDDSAVEQDSIPAQRGSTQASSAITAPDFGGETVTTGHDEQMQDAELRQHDHEPMKPLYKVLVLPMSIVTCDAQRDRSRLLRMRSDCGRLKPFSLACR